MTDIEDAKPGSLPPIIFGTVNAPGYQREFEAMYAALPDDVKASADVIPYPGPYDFCFTLKITLSPVASWAVWETFPRLLDALALLHGAPRSDLLEMAQAWRHKLTEMAQEWRRAKAANAIPSQPAQVVPAIAEAATPEVKQAAKRVTDTPDDVARLKQLRAEHIKAYGKAPAFIATCQLVPMSRTTAKRHAPELCNMKNWKNKNYLPD